MSIQECDQDSLGNLKAAQLCIHCNTLCSWNKRIVVMFADLWTITIAKFMLRQILVFKKRNGIKFIKSNTNNFMQNENQKKDLTPSQKLFG